MSAGNDRPLVLLDERATDDLIEEAFDTLAGFRALAFDTEADSFYRYHEKVCLIQISSPEADYLFDPLAHGLPDRLRALIEADDRLWILHGADFDVLSLRRNFDVGFGQLFDTMIASKFLGRCGLGLAAVLDTELGVKVSKAEQRSDWGKRPLTDKQIRYARQDTMHLLMVADRLIRDLDKVGRLSWVQEECDVLRKRIPVAKVFDPDGWMKIKGARDLSELGRRAVRGGFIWRDAAASKRDRAPFRVITNEALRAIGVEVANRGHGALDRLDNIRGVPPPRHRDGLAEAIRESLDAPETAQVRKSAPTRGARRPGLKGEEKARLARVKQARDTVAAEHALEPGLLLPAAVCESIARDPPGDRDGLSALPGMTRWRADLVAKTLLETV